jgi:hypothetical protein
MFVNIIVKNNERCCVLLVVSLTAISLSLSLGCVVNKYPYIKGLAPLSLSLCIK